MRIKLLLLLAGMLLAEFGYYLYKRYSFEPRHISRHEVKHRNEVLRIGIIGDSWASGTTLDTIISNEFLKHGLKTEIISFGEPEAKTKQIYDNLYASSGSPYSSSEILHHNLDYCIVLTGTSDATGEMGAKFYAYYCSLIISDLLKNNIEPVFITMPDFGFKETTDSLDVLQKARNEVASLIIDNGSTGSLDDYRKQIGQLLKDTHLQDSTIVVPFNMVCDDYKKHKILYRNSGHLSTAGKQKMGKLIVQYILDQLHRSNSQVPLGNRNIVISKSRSVIQPSGS
ncbi:hypothetical protein SAMN05421821_106229 [Mucilaginibacter lappiensis]|uniref:SGNH/GDSL hydrolase family protein n=1 Tax=Mucilaginibacter lappiensis TaxID=354630 RepID=A0ABR6PKY5_9SPHI|nr:hypothetical protein [Mucilaginibacter lappiensis]MBB6110422.1 hypothetical protein [Mucilaginibacter lappiensis]SIR33550.1 hypothetical protein SAMN05421821_106229 [Mucilaginibacter lappiensis]